MSLDIVKKIVKALDDKKGNDIQAIKIDGLTIVADYFVIVTANSTTHVKALADEVEYQLEEAGIRPDHIEGKATGWIVLDYGSVIVHVFGRNEREFYGLDKMWDDAESVDLENILDKSMGD